MPVSRHQWAMMHPGAVATVGFTAQSGYTVTPATTFADDASVTIGGTGFGSGPTVVLYDDFRNTAIDATPALGSPVIGAWSSIRPTSSTLTPPYVRGDQSLSKGKSLKIREPGATSACGTSLSVAPSTEFLISFWARTTTADTAMTAGRFKPTWVMDTGTGFNTDGKFDMCAPTQSTGWALGGNDNQWLWGDVMGYRAPANTWVRWLVWAKDNGASVQGLYYQSINGASQKVVSAPNRDNTFFGSTSSTKFDVINFPGLCDYETWYDNIYVAVGANALARVEIGNAATYSACTSLHLCTPTSWATDSVAVTLRCPESLSGKYLYVTTAAGVTSLIGSFA